jgi:hypothetical protein
MRAVGRVAGWTAFLLLVLSVMAWGGVVPVTPYYFLLPGIALSLLIAFVSIVSSATPRNRVSQSGSTNTREAADTPTL